MHFKTCESLEHMHLKTRELLEHMHLKTCYIILEPEFAKLRNTFPT